MHHPHLTTVQTNELAAKLAKLDSHNIHYLT
jgi:hypothetical protein